MTEKVVERNDTNECYSCKHRRTIPGDCHTLCASPDPNMTGNAHGIKSGWFMYPYNFDPIWKTKRCDSYEQAEQRN